MKMKLKKIRISYMDHPHVLKFYEEVLVYLAGIDTMNFEGLLSQFRNSVETLQNSCLIYHRNLLNKQIELEQRNLQHLLLSIRYRLKNNLASSESTVVALSEKAFIVLKYYYSSKHVSITQKDDKIFNIVDALEDFMTERERQRIGIAAYLKSLKKVNKTLRTLMEKRDQIPTHQTAHNLISDRQNADDRYRLLISFLNLNIQSYSEKMIEQMNEIINRWDDQIKAQLLTKKNHPTSSPNLGVA